MVGFIGRETELQMLQRRYDSGKFECVVVYGRRRIGKTALINRFVQDKPAIFYTATENGAERNLKGLSASIARYRNGLNSLGSPVYEDYRDAFEDVFRMAERDRLILVIDEYPYLAKAEPMVSSLLQQLIDQHHGTGKLMLILSGSSMSFMERQVLGYQSPLYGRRTAQIKVMPFDYRESRGFVPDMGKEDAAVVYGITGGIPQYLIQFDDGVSLEENLRWNVLDPSAYLFEEPGKLLQEELRKPAEYNNIIQTIASGASSGVKIANGSHIEQTVLSHYLRNLSDLHIIVKETPYPEGSRRGIWRIEDLLFRFWYRYIPDNMSLIESGHADIAVQLIMKDLPNYMGGVFEDICRQWLWANTATDRVPFLLTHMGRWWGGDPRTKRQEEIDIVADGKPSGRRLYCECKWRGKSTDIPELEQLRYRSALVDMERKDYMLFSKAGFTDRLRARAAEDGNVRLVSFADM